MNTSVRLDSETVTSSFRDEIYLTSYTAFHTEISEGYQQRELERKAFFADTSYSKLDDRSPKHPPAPLPHRSSLSFPLPLRSSLLFVLSTALCLPSTHAIFLQAALEGFTLWCVFLACVGAGGISVNWLIVAVMVCGGLSLELRCFALFEIAPEEEEFLAEGFLC